MHSSATQGPSLAAAIEPGSEKYSVFVSNQITWGYSKGDPTSVSITIANANSGALDGPFSISENVQTPNKSFNVTSGSAYVVNFINPKNNSEIYASSQPYKIKPAGTAPVYTVMSFYISGNQTKSWTLIETSRANSTSKTPALTGTGLTTLTTSSTSAAGTATTTLRSGNSNHNTATSLQTVSTMAIGFIGAIAGAALLL
ncbi:hypothetical protein FRC05_010270 [Tulasnella sp. 425]|nr:hypothetical protein FRC05_010270 [Tulasnella sp. 425]